MINPVWFTPAGVNIGIDKTGSDRIHPDAFGSNLLGQAYHHVV